MHRRFALLLLALALIGCERYRSRAQGPFPRNQPNPAPAVRQPLALNGPTPPMPPGDSREESPLVPPRPPEPGVLPYAVVPPQSPKAPAVEEERGVEPAGGLPPRKRPATPAAPPQPMSLPTPAAPAAGANLEPLKKIAAATAETVKTLGVYEARFTRRENVDGTPGPTEEVIFRYRQEPMAVYMKNVSEAGLGREVLYNPSQHAEKIHVIVGKGDSRLLKAGFKAPSMSPDSPQVRSKSRHSIRESGVAISSGKFLALMAKYESGKLPADTLKYAGRVKRDDLPGVELEGVEQMVPKGDQGLPSGGTRHWFFDMKTGSPSRGLPVLVILYDGNGKELEYYRYTQFTIPAKLTDADFDPANMGKK
jgi:hypothetical protein